LQEYFGKDTAKRAALICFCSMIFFGVMGQIHLLYAPSPEDVTQAAFFTVLASTPRLLLASFATFFIVQQIDVRFYSLLKKYSVAARVAIALCVSQLFDTALFTLLGLYGIVSSLSDIIVVSFLVKLAIIACMSPLTALSKKIVQHEI
ncbi:MAG TPA: queuosine precursor transporter, partial [Rhabdochlamydiaceae bacterium]